MIFQEKTGVLSVRLALGILAGSAFVAGAAYAQQADVASSEKLQKVEITGSNIKRTEKESDVAIQTITAQDIKNSGAKTVLELMRSAVPGLGTGGYNDTPNQNGFSKGVATADLRNLGSTSTLILLNGRRMAPAAFANPNNGQSTLYDLNNIPVSSLERVEVLKDGASAVYGSDAIGGVINFITKRDYQGAELNMSAGANGKGKFGKQNANGIIGFGDFNKDGYNVFFTLDASTRQRVSAKDGTDGIQQDLYAAINNRFSPFNGSSKSVESSNSYISGSPIFFKETAPGSGSFGLNKNAVITLNCPTSDQVVGTAANKANNALLGRTFCAYNLDQITSVQGKAEDINTLGRGELRINSDMSAFAEAALTRTDRWYTGAPIATNGRSPTTTFTSAGLGVPFQAILPIGHPDNPYTNARAAVAVRFVNSDGNSETISKNTRLLAGLKGTTKDIDWETAVLWNRSSADATTDGRLYLPALRQMTDNNRSIAATMADPNLYRNTTDHNTSEILQWDAKASTEVGHLGGGGIGLAAGVEFRKEKIDLSPDADKAAGNIYGFSNTLLDAQRNVGSAFMEVRAPFTKTFEVDAAGRVDKYPTFKTNFVPKVGAKWTPSDTIAFRGSFSEGFRAPALDQVNPGGAQFFLSQLQDRVRCPDGNNPAPGADVSDCSKSASGTGGVNPDLKPEKSKSWTFGLIFSPTKNFDLALDWYRVRKEGEVILSDAQFTLDHEATHAANVIRDQNQATWLHDASGALIPNSGPLLAIREPWINQGATETSGIDLDMKYRSNLGEYGNLTSGLVMNYVLSYKRAENLGDPEADVAGYNGGLSDWATSGGDIPRVKARLSFNWEKDVHNVYGAVNFVSGISLLRRSDGTTTYPVAYCHYGSGQPSTAYSLGGLPKYTTYFPDCSVSSWTTIDVGYRYTGIKNMTLGFAIANLFDTKAPYDPRYYTNGYNDSLHNNLGRYFTASLNYKFW